MQKTLLRRAGQLMLFTLSLAAAQAQKTPQQVDELKRQILSNPKVASVDISTIRQTPSFIEMKKDGNGLPAAAAPAFLAQTLGVRSGIDYLMPASSLYNANGIEVLQFHQFFKGVRVDHAAVKALAKNGSIAFFTSDWLSVPTSLSIQPALTETQALGYAKATVRAEKYAWEAVEDAMRTTVSTSAKAALQKELDEYLPKAELVIVQDYNKAGIADVRLAYRFNIYAAKPLSRSWIYVDAQNGKLLLLDKIIKHADDEAKRKAQQLPSVNTTVATRYAGTQIIKTKQVSGNDPNSGLPLVSSHPTSELTYLPGGATYVLIDDTKGGGIETYDMNNVGGLPISVPGLQAQAKSFTDVNNNWTPAEHKRSPTIDGAAEAENDDIAFDAHWGAGVVYDYWLAKHNRLSYDGANAKIKSFIHYGPAYDNAFWNGSVMTYGDGSGTAAGGFHALTSLDVCGHEIGHGVCSFTSNLLYQSESGAMNEGLSDIWAACIEHFAMTRSGSTVPSTAYRPFYIGEQIGASYDAPLRRMDNPKAQSNPDTYGGTNWQDPACTPSLANDQCGVHTNSGVINKWFFLLAAGSKNGVRPSGITPNQYYFSDSDDEINDQNEAYTVDGLGFDLAEDITFLMETMLTSTATYAEARTASIAAAATITADPCSNAVKTVTNAWYAVGVGDPFVSGCVTTFGFTQTSGLAISETGTGTVCNKQKTVALSVLVPASASVTVTAGGSAVYGKDYVLFDDAANQINNGGTISNSSSSNAAKQIRITVFDDAEVEGIETVQLTLAVSGNPTANTSYTLSITDNDVVPTIGNSLITLINESFTGANSFSDPAGWTETFETPPGDGNDPMSLGKNQWGVFDNTLSITGRTLDALGTIAGQLPNSTYNTLSESQTRINKSAIVDARGLQNIQMQFDYTVQGEVDPANLNTADPAYSLDYMAVVYSFDGVTWTELLTDGFHRFASPATTSGVFTDTLPEQFNNQQFYIGFRWHNDANAGGPVSVKVDNLTLKGAPRKIETQVAQPSQETVRGNQAVYFYSGADGEVIAKLSNNAANDYGCITASLVKGGNNIYVLYTDAGADNRVADKTVRLLPAANAAVGNYTVTLYFTQAEINGLITSSMDPANNNLYMYQTTASTYQGANGSNTVKVLATYTALPGVGGYFSATFTSSLGIYAVGTGAVNAPLPVNCLDFKASKATDNVGLVWKVGNETAGGSYEVERSADGLSYQSIGIVTSNGSGQYNFMDRSIAGLKAAYYRIKSTEATGAGRYLCTVLYVSFDGRNLFTIGNIYPNPGKGEAIVNVTSGSAHKLRIEYVNAAGQVVNIQTEQVQAGAIRVPLKVYAMAAGSYLIRFKDEEGRTLNAQQFIKQ